MRASTYPEIHVPLVTNAPMSGLAAVRIGAARRRVIRANWALRGARRVTVSDGAV